MNLKKMLVVDVLIAFLALTGFVIYKYGLIHTFELAFANWATILLTTDLLIALTLANIWMWREARSRNINPLPYVIATLLTGSAGVLLYLSRYGFGRGYSRDRSGSGVARPANAT